jgi:TP901 family phage tail tape measure protein
MAFNLEVVLQFSVDRAIAGMKRASARFKGLQGTMEKGREAARRVGTGFRQMALASAPLAIGLGFAAKKAVDFEGKMAEVRAVSRGITEEEFRKMELTAKQLGATTAFTATQAAEGMLLLKKAGFTAMETIGAIPGVLDAAAASGMNLAETSEFVADTLRVFGLQAGEAGDVADILAVTSTSASLTMDDLRESLKFTGFTAAGLGLTLKDTSVILGAMANAGLKGSRAGTSLMNMMTKLIKPSKTGARRMKEMGVSIADAEGNMRPMRSIIEDLIKGLGRYQGNVKKAGVLSEVFGVRGKRATDALLKAFVTGREGTERLIESLEKANGAAKEMAEVRLKSLRGQMTKLLSAVEGVSIEFASQFIPAITGGAKSATSSISDLAVAMQFLGAREKDITPEMRKRFEKISPAIRGFAQGIREAIQDIIEFGKKVKTWLIDKLKLSGKSASEQAKALGNLITKVLIALPAITALGLAFMPLIMLATGVVNVFTGIAGVIIAVKIAIWPLIALIGKAIIGTKLLAGAGLLLSAAWSSVIAPVLLLIIIYKSLKSIMVTLMDEFKGVRDFVQSLTDTIGRLWLVVRKSFALLTGGLKGFRRVEREHEEERKRRLAAAFAAETRPAPGAAPVIGPGAAPAAVSPVAAAAKVPPGIERTIAAAREAGASRQLTQQEWKIINNIILDGRVAGTSIAKSQAETAERGGTTFDPGVRRKIVEGTAVPVYR